ncbi:MAG: hypothetical protein ACXWV1_06130 [Chitinophagaceae bacterium]
MKRILYTALFCFVLFSSCEERPASGPGTMATKPVSIPVGSPTTSPANPGPVPVSNIATTQTGSQKINPAHGQPGHRCDISVGAPLPDGPSQGPKAATLPSSTAITPAIQTAPALQTQPSAPAITKAAVAPGINPAHGQPGHRCDVAVGAPIPKTAASNVKPAATSSPVVPPILQNSPVVPVPQTATATVANGLNPAHGQPGHRCDIEVGKPLNSAPKKDSTKKG